MTMIEPLSSASPYMVNQGNHERDYPGSGSYFQGIYYVFTMYLLCKYYVFTMYIYHVFTMQILRIYYVFTMYFLSNSLAFACAPRLTH